MRNKVAHFYPGLILFSLFIIIALVTYQDYGVSWDERIQREMGLVSYNYVFKGDNSIDTYLERDHGVGFELVLLGVEKLVNAKTYRDIFLTRHLASHFFYLLGTFSMYVLAFRLFGKRWLAILAFLFMLLSPRLYAHSFFNSKDTPLLAMYAISFMVAEWSFRKDKLWSYALLGLCVGYATSIRILGMYLFCCLLLFFLLDVIHAFRNRDHTSRKLKNLFVYVLGAILSVYVFWPTLWKQPFSSFLECYESLSHFRWEGFLLMNGDTFKATEAPWYYLPEWFAITTPLALLLLGVVGLTWVVRGVIMHPLSFMIANKERNFLLYIACFAGPFAAIILLQSVVYDDWRHLYFTYPSFVLLSLYGIDKLMKYKLRIIAVILLCFQLAWIIKFMFSSHPFHQVYFNELVSHKDEYLRKNFDYDFWGASYKQALEYIVQHDKRDTVRIDCCWEPISHNIDF